MLCSLGHGDDVVVIELDDKSVGRFASAGITHVTAGFDWDKGLVLLRPDRRIVSDMKSRDIPKTKILWHGVIHCPNCERKVSKKANYCGHCGQRMSEEIKDLDNNKV